MPRDVLKGGGKQPPPNITNQPKKKGIVGKQSLGRQKNRAKNLGPILKLLGSFKKVLYYLR